MNRSILSQIVNYEIKARGLQFYYL